jgi:hypothetical protein
MRECGRKKKRETMSPFGPAYYTHIRDAGIYIYKIKNLPSGMEDR